MDINARTLKLRWPSGETLGLTSPHVCWDGIQEARVWGKDFVGICLTPPLKRTAPGATTSTFVLTFALDAQTEDASAGH